MQQCAGCGEQNMPVAVFCQQCGGNLAALAQKGDPTAAPLVAAPNTLPAAPTLSPAGKVGMGLVVMGLGIASSTVASLTLLALGSGIGVVFVGRCLPYAGLGLLAGVLRGRATVFVVWWSSFFAGFLDSWVGATLGGYRTGKAPLAFCIAMGFVMGVVGGILPGALGMIGAKFGTFLRGDEKR